MNEAEETTEWQSNHHCCDCDAHAYARRIPCASPIRCQPPKEFLNLILMSAHSVDAMELDWSGRGWQLNMTDSVDNTFCLLFPMKIL